MWMFSGTQVYVRWHGSASSFTQKFVFDKLAFQWQELNKHYFIPVVELDGYKLTNPRLWFCMFYDRKCCSINIFLISLYFDAHIFLIIIDHYCTKQTTPATDMFMMLVCQSYSSCQDVCCVQLVGGEMSLIYILNTCTVKVEWQIPPPVFSSGICRNIPAWKICLKWQIWQIWKIWFWSCNNVEILAKSTRN